MSKRIGVLTIHGMQEGAPEFGENIEEKIKNLLLPEEIERIEFGHVKYFDVFQKSQQKIWGTMPYFPLIGKYFRKKLFNLFSDATSYLHQPEESDSAYQRVHSKVYRTLSEMKKSLGDEAPIIIIAHSLGCLVISNYIWDAQKYHHYAIWEQKDKVKEPFLTFKNARAFYTLGCNIPLFVSSMEHIISFEPPKKFLWNNYYSPIDILGWPLIPLGITGPNPDYPDNPTYSKVVNNDIRVFTGLLWTTAHTSYWKNKTVLTDITKLIKSLL